MDTGGTNVAQDNVNSLLGSLKCLIKHHQSHMQPERTFILKIANMLGGKWQWQEKLEGSF